MKLFSVKHKPTNYQFKKGLHGIELTDSNLVNFEENEHNYYFKEEELKEFEKYGISIFNNEEIFEIKSLD